jgi:hypothetical protein
MSWDLVISEHGDLVFGSNRDLAGVSGNDLLEQRMRLRLKIQRGSWVYDEDENLGSRLNTVSTMRPDQMDTAVRAYVQEALLPMTEIVVTDVQVEIVDSHSITAHVFYVVSGDEETDPEIHELEASVPVVPISGSTATTED